MRFLSTFLSIFLIFLVEYSESNEILGCGGFIKSHAEIDFSKVEVVLFNKQGSIKDKTDCSPSNGYYFIPIYDKGEYILRVYGQAGWSFEPEEIPISFNEVDDVCSQGKDVNFSFKGFGITGKIALAGQTGGAKNVNVELSSQNGAVIKSTQSDINGIFSFSPIVPGKYKIKASRENWYFAKSEYTVEVTSGNTELPENSLVVSGFDVEGTFIGKDLKNVAVALFKTKDNTLVSNCSKGKHPVGLTPSTSGFETTPACYTTLDSQGKYIFKAVAPGKYLIQPVFDNLKLKVHFEPKNNEIQVIKESITVPVDFEISGLSVSGYVFDSENGAGLANAKVKINNNRVISTDQSGKYNIDHLKPGKIQISVEAPDYEFNTISANVELKNPGLPHIAPSAYKVCGSVISEQSYTVGITKLGSTFHTTTISKAGGSGEWCSFLPHGRFTAQVLTTEKDKENGIQFFPVEQTIEVRSKPIKGIVFSQLRATLSGEIKCLPDASSKCNEIEVTLHPLDSTGATNGETEKVKCKNGKYTFSEILPGPYELTIPNSNLCFESRTVLINVNSVKEEAPAFVHTGYSVSFIASHKDKMVYSYVNKDNTASKPEVTQLATGVNTFCVKKSGEYIVKLMGCHVYPDDVPVRFTTTNLSPITFSAIAHHVSFNVVAPKGVKQESVTLLLESSASGQQQLIADYEADKTDVASLLFTTQLEAGEEATLTPISSELLFKPSSQVFVMPNDCVEIAAVFKATNGLIINGSIEPAIPDALITLTFQNTDLPPQTTKSSTDGKFRFGPIDDSFEYKITAEKESYVFSDYNKDTNRFKAFKLCEIIVKAKDEAGESLPGVLSSLSGSESYRKNLVTGEDGTIKFHSLQPSDYFLKPMMKEYKFTPNSKMITVKDGETVEINIVGKRVAYSVFGTVTSLNGELFPNVNMEAVSDDKCMHHQEEATSEANGSYRIRGLKPGCSYKVKAKDPAFNKNVVSTIPSSMKVDIVKNDIQKADFRAIPPITIVDVIASVYATNMEHYKSLRISLYRKGYADQPVYSQKVESPLDMKSSFNPGILVPFPRIPLDGNTYIVELKSTLSERMYTYKLPVETFVANKSTIAIFLNFDATIRSTDTDLNQSSLSALILVIVVAIVFCRQDLAMLFAEVVWGHISNLTQSILKKQQQQKKDPRKAEPINYKEIEQLANDINSIKKKKAKKIN